ncbi:carboxypeptidase-like regulatory domain-containing protein [Micromonospora sp. DT15]|uniref:carboxypeptidase-like regulatory domain-containing protein n=1 Tax=Micromonospora sp. DT15 TaxID=3393445 RepID=UPI003CF082CF
MTNAATGAPVNRALVMVVPYVPHPKYDDHGPTTDEDGRYTIIGLGPYHWPVQFAAAGLATVWSGGVGGRQQARPVRVRAHQTANLNQALPAGIALGGAVVVDELATYAQVIAFDAATARTPRRCGTATPPASTPRPPCGSAGRRSWWTSTSTDPDSGRLPEPSPGPVGGSGGEGG